MFNGPQDAAASLPLANVTRLIELDKNLFVFDTQELFGSELGQRLGEDFAAPAGWSSLEELHADDEATDRGGRKGWQMLSLGGDGAGLGWHVHGASWLGLVAGEKRWFVYRPGQATLAERGHPLHSAADWIASGPAEGAAQPLTCTQRAGELFYLPAGWPHLTSNRGTALGAGGQAPVRSMEEFGALRTGAEAGDPQAQVFVGMALLHQHQVREENQVKLPTPLRMLAAAAASHPLELNARKNNAEGQFLLTREEAGVEAVADYAAALKAAERHLVPSDAFEALLAQLHLTDKHRELLAQEEVADVETLSSLSEEDLTSVPGIPALAQRIEEEGEMGGRVCPHMLLAKGFYELGFLQAQQLKVLDDAAASLERALALANKAPSPEVSIRATWKIRQLAGEVEVRRGNAQVAYGHFQKCLELSDGTIPPSAFGPLSSYLGLAGRTLGCVPQGAGGLRKEGALASSTA